MVAPRLIVVAAPKSLGRLRVGGYRLMWQPGCRIGRP
jgi:hypothetical protein